MGRDHLPRDPVHWREFVCNVTRVHALGDVRATGYHVRVIALGLVVLAAVCVIVAIVQGKD